MDDNARFIVAIADEGSISAAARSMHISQPALSQRLHRLEARLGTTLFDRQSAHLTPTYAGRIYLRWARRAIELEDDAIRKIALVANNGMRRLQVGTSLPRGGGMLIDVAERFMSERGDCTLFFSEAGMPASHESALLENQIDCAVLTPVKPNAPLVRGEVLCRERMVVMAPKDLAIASEDRGGPYRVAAAEELANVPFIMPPHSLKHNQVVRSMMDAAGVRIHVALHSCSNEMTIAMIGRGMGVSIAPNTFAYGRDMSAIACYEVDGLPYYSDLYYNRRADLEATADEVCFVGMLREWIAGRPELLPAG